jgi:CIC family chloride channel protein
MLGSLEKPLPHPVPRPVGSAQHASQRAPRRDHFLRVAVVGLSAGILAVAFRHALAWAESLRTDLLAHLHACPHWGWAVLPSIGLVVGCLVGWCTRRFAPDAAGSGIPHLKGVLLHVRTLEWKRLIPVKFLGGVLGIGSGLSLGREGPTVQMGAAIARALAGPLRTPPADLPQLLSAGAGAGLAAAFNAPLAGLLFVIEELHRELSARTATGALVAAVCATVVTHWLAGDTPSFEIHGLGAMSLGSLPMAAGIGVIAGLGGVAFNWALLTTQETAISQRAFPRWLLPGLVAMFAGLAAWWMPGAIGAGHAVAEQVLGGTLGAGLGTLAVLLVLKFAFTALSYGSGAPGGIFAPMLLLGALCGATCAKSVALVVPAWGQQEQILAVLGMAGFFVSSVRAPMTGIVLISEMTGGYQLLFPICITGLAAYLVGEGLRSRPIYDALLEADLERCGHGRQTPAPRTVYIGIQSGSPLAGQPIARAGLPRGCLIVCVERAGASVLPTGETVLQAGDHISVLTPGAEPQMPLEIMHLCTGL